MQHGGFNFLTSTDINFATLETSGIDLALSYDFSIGAHNFGATVQGTKVNEIDFYTNPADLSEVNPQLGQILRPEEAGNVYLSWDYGDINVSFQSQYLGEMLLGTIEIETAETLYGKKVFMDETWIHNISASYNYSDEVTLYGGIRNLNEEDPFMTENAFPTSPRGRMIFIGGTYRL